MTLRKNITTILFAALAACMLTACFSDDTTNGDRPLCEITIDEASVKTVYNIYKNETLTTRLLANQRQPATHLYLGDWTGGIQPRATAHLCRQGTWQLAMQAHS